MYIVRLDCGGLMRCHLTSQSCIKHVCQADYSQGVCYRCSAYIFPALKTFRLTFLRMRDICKIINVQRKDKAFMV